MEEIMADLNLYFPQWQGGGQKSLYIGAAAARKGLNLKSRLTEVKLDSEEKLEKENEIIGYRPIVKQLETANKMIKEKKPYSIFTLGGGCDVELAPISYLNQYYDKEMSVLWIDAHAGLNTPETSQNNLFHGMPLRTLLEDSINEIDKLCFSKITPEQVVLMGARDLEPAEEKYIQEKQIKHMSPDDVIWTDPTEWIENLKPQVYLHISLDVMDEKTFPKTLRPAGKGLQFKHLLGLIEKLETERRIVGMSLLDYASSEPLISDELKKIAAVGLWI
jgi:arginase